MIIGFIGFCFLIAAITMLLLRLHGTGISYYEVFLVGFIGGALSGYQPDFFDMIRSMFMLAIVGGVW